MEVNISPNQFQMSDAFGMRYLSTYSAHSSATRAPKERIV